MVFTEGDKCLLREEVDSFVGRLKTLAEKIARLGEPAEALPNVVGRRKPAGFLLEVAESSDLVERQHSQKPKPPEYANVAGGELGRCHGLRVYPISG